MAFPVGRTLSPTALARRHELTVGGRTRRIGLPIAWSRFGGAQYAEPALALAADTWTEMSRGEYAAVALFSRIAAALAFTGAPLDLVSAATRIPEDEIRHADHALRAASMLAGRDVAITFDAETSNAYWGRIESLEDLDGAMAELSAVDETLAAALMRACEDRASDPVVKSVFASLLADEVHHARIGWYYLSWRAPQWSRAERQRVADRVGTVLVRMEAQYGQGRDAPPDALRDARALGVLDTYSQREVVRRVVEDEIVPGLDALGLGASHAWNGRVRVESKTLTKAPE